MVHSIPPIIEHNGWRLISFGEIFIVRETFTKATVIFDLQSTKLQAMDSRDKLNNFFFLFLFRFSLCKSREREEKKKEDELISMLCECEIKFQRLYIYIHKRFEASDCRTCTNYQAIYCHWIDVVSVAVGTFFFCISSNTKTTLLHVMIYWKMNEWERN